MKKLILTACLLLCIGGLLYVLALRSAQPHADSYQFSLSEQILPPAPYPQDFALQLGQIQGVEIELRAAASLPRGICWQQAHGFPEIGSPQARKGGTMRLCNVGPFPANFLAFGSPSPQFFHYNMFDCVEVPLVRAHPDSGELIPGLAEAWALHEGMLWFRLHPQARYSNGRPVRAADFALGALLRSRSGQRALADFASCLHVYGDSVLAVKPRVLGVLPHLSAAAVLHPAEPGFYAEFGSDYTTRYAHRVPPTTGAYSVCAVQRGRFIALQRNKNWWAAQLPGFRYTHNADVIEHHFLTDEAQAWEFFLKGKLDLMQTRNIAAWQQYLSSPPQGVRCHRFELTYPMPPYGIALNARTIPDVNIRRGLLFSLDMQAAMQLIFRGEAQRLPQFAVGYRHLPTTAPVYEYNPQAARAAFAAAGFSLVGADGFLRNQQGHKLSVRLTFSPSLKVSTLVQTLARRAAACGVEIVAEPLPWQSCARQVREQSHDMLFWATVAGHPLPDYRSCFHSDSRGDDAPFCLNSKEVDAAIIAVEEAASLPELAAASARLEQLIYEQAVWLPAWMENRVNVAVHSRVHLPQQGYGTYDVADSHTYWLSD